MLIFFGALPTATVSEAGVVVKLILLPLRIGRPSPIDQVAPSSRRHPDRASSRCRRRKFPHWTIDRWRRRTQTSDRSGVDEDQTGAVTKARPSEAGGGTAERDTARASDMRTPGPITLSPDKRVARGQLCRRVARSEREPVCGAEYHSPPIDDRR